MKIELEEPFKSLWTHGYVYRSSVDGRARVCLVNSKTDRTFMAYARYLMGVKLGRPLTEDEEVDHIDTDGTNDDLDNLQVLSVSEHKKKTDEENTTGRTMVELHCSFCGCAFEREKRKIAPTTVNFFCCREHLWESQKL